MKVYAFIQSGKVYEIINPVVYDTEVPDWVEGDPARIGKEIPIEERFPSGFIENLVNITNMNSVPAVGWSYNSSNGTFSAPISDLPPVSKQEMEELRLLAYAHPITGVDRHFIEAMSLQAEGFTASSVEVKEAKAKGLARKLEIQALYPYPVE